VKYSYFNSWIFSLSCLLSFISADISGELRVCALMVEFQEDDKESTTGTGKFLNSIEGIDCGVYHIDPPPHDRNYFFSQLKAVNNYFQSVSYGQFGLDLVQSSIYPSESISYELSKSMSYYFPYNEENISEDRLVGLFKETLELAHSIDGIDYSDYDLIIVFHAGIGQDFSLPFLDPTPEDIPSTFVDPKMIKNSTGENVIIIGSAMIDKGIILPETQNHLNYGISNSMFASESDPCDYQYGLNGTLSLMVGFAVGLPPLWDIESGESRIGVFGLMDQGSNNGRGVVPSPPDPWSRIFAGWETPNIIQDNSLITLPNRSMDNIIRIDLNESEYFLIENRVNFFRKGVSVDSLRFKTWKETDTYPSFIKSLKDSVNIESDDNGVIVRIPNYDIGLPGTGLIIWHIDENRIQSGLNDYSINKNINHVGIDIEEADGAQDIGNESFFMFNDPSSGYFGDIWFAENKEYYRANPQNEGILPIFNESTYPNTNSNNGSRSYVSIENIGPASDTITFSIINTLKPYGYSDSSAYYRASFPLENSELTLIIGGLDSLWFKMNLSDDLKVEFHELISSNAVLGFNSSSQSFLIEVFEYFDSSVTLSVYELSNNYENVSLLEATIIDSLVYPIYSSDFKERSLLSKDQWNKHNNYVVDTNYEFKIEDYSVLSSVKIEDGEENLLNNIYSVSISGIDLELDGNLDVLVIDETGTLSAFNHQLISLSSFPIEEKVIGPLLSKNILGDAFPEIIVKSIDSSSIYIFDYQGKLLSSISTDKNDELVFLETIDQKNCLFTRYNVYQFDSYSDSKGNQWISLNGDQANTRSISLEYSSNQNNTELVSRAYCYPNPIKFSSAKIRIETNNASLLEVKVYDAAGYYIKKFTKNLNDNGYRITEWDLDTSKLEPGIYFARLEAKSNSTNSAKSDSKVIKIAVIK